MAASNRASRLTKLVADLKKRYKPTPPEPRPLFETILFATLAENSPLDAAAKALAELEGAYFDWNEVRVSSRAELAERLKPLNDPTDSADRLKRTLQSIFESIYAFDLELLKKQNLGQAVKQIAGYDGVTPFVAAFATQHGLAGHAIAVNSGVLIALQVMDIITEAEAKKCQVPGLERAIPKNKGPEAQAALHEMGVEIAKNPYGTAARKLLTDIDPSCKDRLPKRPAKVEPAPPKAPAKPKTQPKAAPAKPPAKEATAPPKSGAKKTKTEKPAAAAPKPAKKKAAAPKKSSAKSTTTKKAPKKPAAKSATKKAPTKKTPAKKATAKKATAKKTATKAPGKKPAKRKPK